MFVAEHGSFWVDGGAVMVEVGVTALWSSRDNCLRKTEIGAGWV